MRQLDDIVLVAYVDGELDSETEREVAQAVASDPEAREIVEALRKSAELVRTAFEERDGEPVSPRLLATLKLR